MLGYGQPMSNYGMLIPASLDCTCTQETGDTQEAYCSHKQVRKKGLWFNKSIWSTRKNELVLVPQVSGSPRILAEVQATIVSINIDYSKKPNTHLHICTFRLHGGFISFISEG